MTDHPTAYREPKVHSRPEREQLDALATISAGFKRGDNPVASRDHKIYLHDDPTYPRAEGLKAALEATRYRGLTVAFPFQHEGEFIRWHYAAYTRSSLLWAGDDDALTVFTKDGAGQVSSGTEEYERLVLDPRTKINYSVYFVLTEWLDATNIERVFPDGFSVYRLRTTSKKTIDNLRTALRTVRNISGGHFAGVPFDLRLVNYDGVDKNGLKRTFPVFTFAMKPRGELRLSSANFQAALTSGNAAAAALQLPPIRDPDPLSEPNLEVAPETAPAPATEEPLEADFVPVSRGSTTPRGGSLSDSENGSYDAALQNLEHNKDPEGMKRAWFALVKNSELDSDEARADFLARHVDGVASLSHVVGLLRPEQFSELLVLAQNEIDEHRKKAAATAALEETKWHDSITGPTATLFVQAVREAEISRLEVFPLLEMLGKRKIDGRSDIRIEEIGLFLDAFGVYDSGGGWWLDAERAEATKTRFDAWLSSDESALGVL